MKPGNWVTMTGKYADMPADGTVYRVKSMPFMVCGTVCVFLDGWNGCVAMDGLKRVRRKRPPMM